MKKILDWRNYENAAVNAIAEGCVLLENKNQVLPLKSGSTVSIFGRIQSSYYKSGTGSGGKVNVTKVYSIVDGLELCPQIKINRELQNIYAEWEKENPYDEGLGWGKERWSQDEMPLTDQIVSDAAKKSDVALVIIGRTAGEDKDNSNTESSYLLTKDEMDMLKKIRKGFSKMVVLLNVGNVIDMSFVDEAQPDSVMYIWQGGMMGGIGTAKVLTGEICPSGKLTDTIAYNLEDYPSHKYFGDPAKNCYSEDIFVGYRYFETFAKEKVRYPFGFGLSYSTFAVEKKSAENNFDGKSVKISVDVKNTGNVSAKEVVQIYVQAPQGKLGKAEKVLVDFEKTNSLNQNQIETVAFNIPYDRFSSYDDSGVTGHKSCWVLENGTYKIFAGTDIRSAQPIFEFTLNETIVLEQLEEALAPVEPFKRFHASPESKLEMEDAPLRTVSMIQRRNENLPKEIPQTNSTDIKLKDVLENKSSVEDFVAQFSDDDLSCIVRGEGMGSSLVTAGTASAFGGVSPKLRDTFGIPACCCDDGPSGMRLDCGIKAFALPNGTSLACSFNKKLVTELYEFTGLEMIANRVDNLLGPGMNIHRYPLNGRNFEYFSEDPFLTGQMGTAMVIGLRNAGVTGTIKHFCGNNQEKNRREFNSIISERALREIYLKGFEIAVKSGYANSVMTTYGMVNGLFTAGCYDLTTTILRNEWGFKGIAMTDWWASINEENPDVEPSITNFAAMVKAQNDLYMVCPNGAKNESGDNTLQSLAEKNLERSELQRCAINICEHAMKTPAMERLLGTAPEIEILNKPKDENDISPDDVEFTILDGEKTFDLTYQECKANASYLMAMDTKKLGTYEVSLTGSSELGELAQLPCTLFTTGIPIATFTFNGTGGKDVTITKEFKIRQRFCISRIVCSSNGLKLKKVTLKYVSDDLGTFLAP